MCKVRNKVCVAFFMALFFAQPTLSATVDSVDQQKKALDFHMETITKMFQKGLDYDLKESDNITMIAGGFSKADLFQVTTPDGKFIVKIMKDSPEEDIVTEAIATNITGETGAGPRFYYSHLKAKTVLRGAVGNEGEINRHDAPFHKMVAGEIRKLHGGKLLNRNQLFFDILRQDEKRLVDLKTVSPLLRPEDAALYAKMSAEVESVFAHFPEDIRAVHHDISPHNILYDGTRSWLIDWETASNDYYPIDLCMFANFHVYDESLLPQFLEAYYGRPATELEWAKFHVIRPFCYAFHGFRLAFLSNFRTMPDLGKVMEYKDFQLAIRQGKYALGSSKSLLTLSVSTMNKSMTMLREANFQKSLKILQEHIANIKKEKSV